MDLQSVIDGLHLPPIEELKLQGMILGSCVVFLWILELIDVLFLKGWLNQGGIRPRQLSGLKGIVLSPVLHGDLKHLAANTMPLLILGWLVLLAGLQTFIVVTVCIWLISGWGVWFIGRSRSLHIGASGIVFGYLGFLLARAYFEASFMAIAFAVIAMFLYGGMIWGVLPLRRKQSWEGHFCGLVGGGLAARFLTELNQWADIHWPF